MPSLVFNLKQNEPEPDATTAFADDMCGLIETEPSSIRELDSILNDFGTLSGLNINASKTKVIPVGKKPEQRFLDCVTELGYSIDDKFQLLGFQFDSKLENMHVNWTEKN